MVLAGRTIGITADRRWEEQAELFRRRGASVLHGPTVRTRDVAGDDGLSAATAALLDRPPDVVVAVTGMGIRKWVKAAAEGGVDDRLAAVLKRSHVIARGP